MSRASIDELVNNFNSIKVRLEHVIAYKTAALN